MPGLYRFARGLLRILIAVSFRVEYRGLNHIPPNGHSYIIASNHTSYIDPMLLAIRVPSMIHFMAKVELTGSAFATWLFEKKLGVVPVARGTGDRGAIERCAELTRAGGVLGIFPEGTRYRTGVPGRPKSGMALIAKMTGADILPVSVYYERPIRFRSRILVVFGELIPHGELQLDEDSPRALKRATKRVWDDILGMLGVQGDEA